MTATVQYWRLPEEEADMVAYLASLGPTVALPMRRVPRKEALVWRPIEEALRDDADSFLIAPAEHAQLIVHHNEDGFAADVTSTPALLYTRGRLAAKQLVFTSLAGSWDHLAEDGKTVVDKPTDFVRWGKKVMQWVRRVAPNTYRFKQHRITPKAEAARDAGMEMIL